VQGELHRHAEQHRGEDGIAQRLARDGVALVVRGGVEQEDRTEGADRRLVDAAREEAARHRKVRLLVLLACIHAPLV